MGVIVGSGKNGVDLSAVTATAADVAVGKEFYSSDGTLSEGELWLPNGASTLYTVNFNPRVSYSGGSSFVSINFIRMYNGQLRWNDSTLTYYKTRPSDGNLAITQGFYCPKSTIILLNAHCSEQYSYGSYLQLYEGNSSGTLLRQNTGYNNYNVLYYKVD